MALAAKPNETMTTSIARNRSNIYNRDTVKQHRLLEGCLESCAMYNGRRIAAAA
jgi:hypothetical protein